MKVLVIIPTHNESQKIYDVVQGVRSRGYDVVVVDDGSSDNTVQEARRAGAKVLKHYINRGYGAALETGNQYALRRSYDVIVHFDGDGQHDPEEIINLVKPIQEGLTDVVIGSRFLKCDANHTHMSRIGRVPLVRKILIKLAILFTWIFSGIRLTDAHNGFRAFSRNALEILNCQQDGMSYSSEVIDQIAEHELRLVEVPNTIVYSEYSVAKGESNIKKIFVGLKFLWGKIVK
jgi:glycosyltransferase involved in cell wall biosynthesis